MMPTTPLPSLSSMSAHSTLAPSAAKIFAVDAPMPDAAPVTMATLSLRRMMFPPHNCPNDHYGFTRVLLAPSTHVGPDRSSRRRQLDRQARQLPQAVVELAPRLGG